MATIPSPAYGQGIEQRVEHRYAHHEGVKIHYVTLGAGPPVVMLHGFPDFWYSWRHLMERLAPDYRVVAMDLRGYNRSDHPVGVENYDMRLLVGDVAAVIRDLGVERATIVGHDWGGAIAWQFAMHVPEMTERLIILNLPHPRGLLRELATNADQRANSQYARNFQQPNAHKGLTAEGLAGWVRDPEAKAKYVKAFQRSSFEGMLHYYKRNYPREPYTEDTGPLVKVRVPVLMIHGLADQFLLHPALAGTWQWVERDLTLVTIPSASHFVHHDEPDLVARSVRAWLGR